jgi:hypothetical protein
MSSVNDVRKALKWDVKLHLLLKKLRANITLLKEDINESKTKNEVKEVKSALKVAKHIGKTERRFNVYEKHVEDFIKEAESDILERMHAKANGVLKVCSLYDGELIKMLNHLEEEIDDSEIEQAHALIIELEQLIDRIDCLIEGLLPDFYEARELLKRANREDDKYILNLCLKTFQKYEEGNTDKVKWEDIEHACDLKFGKGWRKFLDRKYKKLIDMQKKDEVALERYHDGKKKIKSKIDAKYNYQFDVKGENDEKIRSLKRKIGKKYEKELRSSINLFLHCTSWENNVIGILNNGVSPGSIIRYGEGERRNFAVSGYLATKREERAMNRYFSGMYGEYTIIIDFNRLNRNLIDGLFFIPDSKDPEHHPTYEGRIPPDAIIGVTGFTKKIIIFSYLIKCKDRKEMLLFLNLVRPKLEVWPNCEFVRKESLTQ